MRLLIFPFALFPLKVLSIPHLSRTICNFFKIVSQTISRVDFSARPFKVWSGDEVYEAKAIIISTGASAKRLGLENEKKLYGKGVSACATCDGFFFKNKFDMIFCRNVMIYFDDSNRHELIGKYTKLLPKGAPLFLGSSESLTTHRDSLKLLGSSIYQRL